MKTVSARDARSRFNKLIRGKEAVIGTCNGKPAAAIYPLSDSAKLPMAMRRVKGPRRDRGGRPT